RGSLVLRERGRRVAGWAFARGGRPDRLALRPGDDSGRGALDLRSRERRERSAAGRLARPGAAARRGALGVPEVRGAIGTEEPPQLLVGRGGGALAGRGD